MKNFVRNLLQKILTFKNYLYLFSLYSIRNVEKGKYEKEFIHFLGMVRDNGIILDIGANIGITAVPLAKRFPNAEVHAFEPIKENYSTLERVIRHFKLSNIKLFNLALGEQKGSLKMIMPVLGNARMQGLSKAYEEGIDEKGTLYDVPMERLDDLYPKTTTINAIKIDVENFEYQVLKGAQKLLDRNKPIIYCELWDNENRVAVFELLTSMGYRIFSYNEQSASLSEVSKSDKLGGNNFFFVCS
jgi:FkbM family methyltransferase